MPQRTTNPQHLPQTTAARHARLPASIAALATATSLLLAGCGSSDTPPDADQGQSSEQATAQNPEQGQDTPYTLAELEAAKPVSVSPEQVAETFALGGKSTDLQRALLEKEVAGNVVEWDLQLYEVSLDGDTYTVSTQPVPIADEDAVNLIRIIAQVRARTPEEHAFLSAVKTGDPIRVRGRVTTIALRTAVVLDPAVVVNATAAK